MASFTNQIGYLTGDASSNDPSTIAQALKDGIVEVITKVAQINPALLHTMSGDFSLSSNSDADGTVDGINIVLNVNRYDSTSSKTRNCTPIDRKFISKATDTDSIYYAPKTSPVYAINNQTVEIYPAPTATELGTLTKVVIGVANDSAGTITYMPEFLYIQVVRYAAFVVLLQRLGQITASLPTDLDDTTVFDAIADVDITLPALTKSLPSNFSINTSLPSFTTISFPSADVQDALDKAKALMDDSGQIGGDVNVDGSGTDIYSVQKWLIDEDPEMLGGTISAISQELQRANMIITEHTSAVSSSSQEFNNEVQKYSTEISKEAQRVGLDISEYQAELQKNLSEKNNELQEYQANLGKNIQLFTTLIGKLTTDYQWIQQQLATVKSLLDQGWNNISTGIHDSEVKSAGGGIGK